MVQPQTRFETTFPSTSLSSTYVIAYDKEGFSSTSTAVTASQAMSFDKCFVSSMAIVNTNSNASMGTGVLAVPGETRMRRFNVSRKDLLGVPNKWYRMAALSGVDTDVTQGNWLFAVEDSAGANTVELDCVMSYDIEFTGGMDFADVGVSRKVERATLRDVEEKEKEADGVLVVPQRVVKRLPK